MRRKLIIAFGLVAALVVLALGWWRSPPPGLDAWSSGPPTGTWSIREQQLDAWRQLGVERDILFAYRSLGEIPVDLQVAVLVGEDINFFGHRGVDWEAVREAIDEWRSGQRLRGASTITQQLAKNIFFTGERSLLRKLREARMAWWMERELGKRRILELYLNVIEFDEGVFGVDAAARHFYGKPLDGLGVEELAGLAATIPAPRTANPSSGAESWRNRRAVILTRMSGVDWLRRQLEGS